MNDTGPSAPPVRFADAERLNPYQLLLDLHDHALGRSTDPAQEEVLAELALAAAVVAWWSRWQPLTIHTALRAGSGLADITAATGLDQHEVVRRWRTWTEVQTRLIIGGRPALDAEDVRTIGERLRQETDQWT